MGVVKHHAIQEASDPIGEELLHRKFVGRKRFGQIGVRRWIDVREQCMSPAWFPYRLDENRADTERFHTVEDSYMQADRHPRVAQVLRLLFIAADEDFPRKVLDQDRG